MPAAWRFAPACAATGTASSICSPQAATDRRYCNEIGVDARADDIDETVAALAEHGLAAEAVYGVRLVTDGVDVDTPVPADPDELAALLDAEDALCRTDPYRRVATLFHVIARRPH
ncbi:MAG: hypothetical protein WKF58_04095 [Ilumatobacteraceae bacterium]